MGGCCCCCASKSPQFNRSPAYFHYPVSEEREPLSSHRATVSALSTGLLVDTNLDTTISDTYRPPPAPLPYETNVGYPPTPSVHQQSTGNKIETTLQSTNTELVGDTNSGSTLDAKLKNLESDEKMETHIELTASKEMEDNNSDELTKFSEPFVPLLQNEEDICPTCLEGNGLQSYYRRIIFRVLQSVSYKRTWDVQIQGSGPLCALLLSLVWL